ncbi:zinc ribbon domain-containing protein [Anaerosporobacter faecicola]|uniref:zinc-ribbon domain-containing protein n=1 Tax=Anaerosporobacter faecicola TaxID=2718714 RepID=UPI0014397A80|nr:zinc-ribbon domain-containing protein [Anaerosporobacter faecicola]
MIICKVCGRHIENDNANFCENCGESLREHSSFEYQEPVKPAVQNTIEGASNEIPFRTFMGVLLLQLIPGVGWLIYAIVLVTWLLGNQYSQTHKNFAKASLIMSLISLVGAVFLVSSGYFPLS